MAHVQGKLFWRDLERHHPGISSLRLAPEAAASWKQRILVKTTRSVTAAGAVAGVTGLEHRVGSPAAGT